MNTVTVWVYMLRCADKSYYVGKYQGAELESRASEHNTGAYENAYTARRRPVELVWADWFSRYDDAVAFERRLKGWSRAKKEALIRNDEAALKECSQRGFRPSAILRDAPLRAAPQDEGEVGCKQFLHPQHEGDTQSLHPEEGRRPVTKDEGTARP